MALTRGRVAAGLVGALGLVSAITLTTGTDTPPSLRAYCATVDARPIPADARYVSPTGNDAGPGTLEQPWRTWDRMASNTTLVFRGGVYLAPRYIGASAAKPLANLTLRAYPGETPVFRNGTYGIGASSPAVHDITVAGLTFEDFTASDSGMWTVIDGAYNFVFECNAFRRIGAKTTEHAIYPGGGGPHDITVRANVFEDVAGAGVHVYATSNAAKRVTISDNVFTRGQWGVLLTNAGIADVSVARNTFVGQAQAGIRLFAYGGGGATGVRIVDNVALSPTGMRIDSPAGWATSWSSTGNYWSGACPVNVAGQCMTSPAAVAAVTSPSIGAGDTFGLPPISTTSTSTTSTTTTSTIGTTATTTAQPSGTTPTTAPCLRIRASGGTVTVNGVAYKTISADVCK